MALDFREIALRKHNRENPNELWVELTMFPGMLRGVDFVVVWRDGQKLRLITEKAHRVLSRIQQRKYQDEILNRRRDRPVFAEVDEGSILD